MSDTPAVPVETRPPWPPKGTYRHRDGGEYSFTGHGEHDRMSAPFFWRSEPSNWWPTAAFEDGTLTFVRSAPAEAAPQVHPLVCACGKPWPTMYCGGEPREFPKPSGEEVVGQSPRPPETRVRESAAERSSGNAVAEDAAPASRATQHSTANPPGWPPVCLDCGMRDGENGQHDYAHPFRPAPSVPARVTEPRGCPTPGACSCPGYESSVPTGDANLFVTGKHPTCKQCGSMQIPTCVNGCDGRTVVSAESQGKAGAEGTKEASPGAPAQPAPPCQPTIREEGAAVKEPDERASETPVSADPSTGGAVDRTSPLPHRDSMAAPTVDEWNRRHAEPSAGMSTQAAPKGEPTP